MGTDENKVKRTYEWHMRTCQWHAYKSIQNVNNKDWQQNNKILNL